MSTSRTYKYKFSTSRFYFFITLYHLIVNYTKFYDIHNVTGEKSSVDKVVPKAINTSLGLPSLILFFSLIFFNKTEFKPILVFYAIKSFYCINSHAIKFSFSLFLYIFFCFVSISLWIKTSFGYQLMWIVKWVLYTQCSGWR